MTGNELLNAIRDALPCPYGTSVDVQGIDSNGDVCVKLILCEPYHPSDLKDVHLSFKSAQKE